MFCFADCSRSHNFTQSKQITSSVLLPYVQTARYEPEDKNHRTIPIIMACTSNTWRNTHILMVPEVFFFCRENSRTHLSFSIYVRLQTVSRSRRIHMHERVTIAFPEYKTMFVKQEPVFISKSFTRHRQLFKNRTTCVGKLVVLMRGFDMSVRSSCNNFI